MAKVVAGMTMSLGGFIRDRTGSVGALYPDLDVLRNTEFMRETIRNTGAVVMGRNAFAMARDPDWFAGNHESQVPLFVLTHEPPKKHPKETDHLTLTFVTDGIESAIRQAQAAAGQKDIVVLGGASTVQECINAGLANELVVTIMPVLLCGGIRLFENVGTEPIRLEKVKVLDLPAGRTHLVFRVIRLRRTKISVRVVILHATLSLDH